MKTMNMQTNSDLWLFLCWPVLPPPPPPPCLPSGYAALNKVLGRPVYSSHMQLGGPRVMGVNGISHHLVQVRA
jgi:hypothetical protein